MKSQMKNLSKNSFSNTIKLIVVTLILTACQFVYSQPLKIGQSVVTSHDGGNSNYNCVKVIDLNNRPNFSTGGHYWNPNSYAHADWTHSRMGEVFGIAIDDNNPPNIYVSTTNIYWGNLHPQGPALIYKINGSTWNVSDYVVRDNTTPGPPTFGSNSIPNTGPEMGNICYDKWHKQLFATNMEDGKIYRIKDAGGNAVVGSAFDPFTVDVPSNGFPVLGEKIWGIGVYGSSSADVRVYFSRWVTNSYLSNPKNEIWSIALDYNGEFINNSIERLEITLPYLTGQNYSNPVSDIEFADNGRMLVAERSMFANTSVAHESRILEYPRSSTGFYVNNNYKWHKIGVYGSFTNSCGGAAYQFSYADSTHNVFIGCDSVIVGTGDYLFTSPGIIYGLQFTDKTYGSGNYLDYSHFIDVNGSFGTQDKDTPGDVDVYKGSVVCGCSTPDSLYIKDSNLDLGYEPNNQSGSVMWASNDIWVCAPPSPGSCSSHGNPITGFNNTVRVRIRNKNLDYNSCNDAVVTLQWAKASTALSWPTPWDGSQYNSGGFAMGALIGTQKIPNIPANGEVILNFNWSPPNPNNYSTIGGYTKSHFCLLARIETKKNDPYGMTFPEVNGALYDNVKNNNQIAWKNVEVVFLGPIDFTRSFNVGNVHPLPRIKKFSFQDDTNGVLFSNTSVKIKLSGPLYQIWAAGGKQGNNVQEQSDSTLRVLSNGAYITNLLLDSNSTYDMGVKIIPTDTIKVSGQSLDVIQYDVASNKIDGGNRFYMSSEYASGTSLGITVIPEGFLQAASINTTRSNIKDKSKIFLRSSVSPYQVVDTASVEIDSLTLSGACFFTNASSGNYYIAVTHRNSIETWSKNPVAFTAGDMTSYDFTTSSSKAYGNNLVLKFGKWCTYSGDVNQDGNIDVVDVSQVDNDVFNFVAGYVNTDVNGDNIDDANDLAIVDNNAFNFVSKITPP